MQRQRTQVTIAATVAVASLAWTGSASADVVFGSKKPCPPGSAGQLSHTGPWCAPVACAADAECESFFDRDRSDKSVKAPKEPMICADHGLCVKTETVKQMGGWAGGQTITKEIAVSVCGPSGACPDATCSRAKRCVPKRLGGGGGTGTAPPTSTTAPPSAGDAGTASAPDASAPAPDAGEPATPPTPTTDTGSSEPAPGGPRPESSSCGRCAAGPSSTGAARLLGLVLPLVALGARRMRRRPAR